MKKVRLLSLLGLLLLGSCFKREGDLLLVLPSEEAHPLGTTIYPVNDKQVMAQRVDEAGNIAWIFRASDVSGTPLFIRAATIIPGDGALRQNLLFDTEGRLSFLYASRQDGTRLPDLIRFRYPAEGRCLLARFTTDWSSDYRLEWEATIDQQTGLALPVYLRDECGRLQAGGQAIEEALSVLQITAGTQFLQLPDWLQQALTTSLPSVGDRLTDACNESLRFAENGPPPTVVPENPAQLQEALLTGTDIQACSNNAPEDFKVERSVNGEITFRNITGGRVPFSYSVDGSDFQTDAGFAGPFEAGQPFLMMVRDANGCVLAKLEMPPAAPPRKAPLQRIRVQSNAQQYDIHFSYDGLERIEKVSIGDSNISEYLYDGDQLMRVTSYDPATPTDKYYEEYNYDSEGRLLQVRYRRSGSITAVFDCSYDDSGRLVRYERSDNNFEEGKEELFGFSFEYNAAGNLKVARKVVRESSTVKRLFRYDFTHSQAVNPLDAVGVYLEPLHHPAGQLKPLVANDWFSPNAVERTLFINSSGMVEAQYRFEYQYDAQQRLSSVTRNRSGGGLTETTTMDFIYR